MKKILGVAILGLALLGLTGCMDAEEREAERQSILDHEREMIQVGKECDLAGGTWEFDSFLGNWTCSFTGNK